MFFTRQMMLNDTFEFLSNGTLESIEFPHVTNLIYNIRFVMCSPYLKQLLFKLESKKICILITRLKNVYKKRKLVHALVFYKYYFFLNADLHWIRFSNPVLLTSSASI